MQEETDGSVRTRSRQKLQNELPNDKGVPLLQAYFLVIFAATDVTEFSGKLSFGGFCLSFHKIYLCY